MKKIIILIVILFLTGCSYRELNELAIGSALGIDYIGNNYEITVQVLNLKKNGENEEQSSIIYKGTGKTISNAIRNISLSYPKTLYLGHLELVILGSSTLDHDIEELFDFFIRSPETRNDFDVLINPSGSAKEILSLKDENTNSFPSKEIINTIENSMEKQGSTVKVNMEELISNYLKKGIVPVSTAIESIDNNNVLTGIIAINNDNSIVKLNNEQAIAYNLINENFYDINIITNYENTLLDSYIGIPKSNIDLKIDNNKIKINIDIKLVSQIAEIRKKANLEDTKVQKKIEDNINKTVEKYLESLVTICKNENIDILGLENIIYKKYFKNYKEFENKNIYEISDIKINVDTKLYRYGNLYRSTKGE